jgi:chromate transporter
MAAADGGESPAAGHDPAQNGGSPQSPSSGHVPVRLSEIARTFAKIGTIGFGGGVGMLALIRQEVVEKRRWIDDAQLSVAVAMGQMLPGPFVSNYAEYIGYDLRSMRGMVTAHVSLMLPCFVLMLVLSMLYFRFGSMPIVAKLFSGVQPVVVGILAWATWSIGKANIKGWRSVIIGIVAAGALFLKVDVLLVVIGCGVLGIILGWGKGRGGGISPQRHQDTKRSCQNPRTPEPPNPDRNRLEANLATGTNVALLGVMPLLPALFVVAAAVPDAWQKAGELALVFLKIGAATFGGGFAAIPFLQHEVVDVRHWLTMQEFIDGVALGQVTPGPVAITGAFVGFKVLGLAGAIIAYLGTFLPSFLMLWGLIHIYRRVQYNRVVQGFLSGVMPAVTGMILTATIFIGRTAIVGPVAAIVALLTLSLLLRYRLEPVWLILGGALVGMFL